MKYLKKIACILVLLLFWVYGFPFLLNKAMDCPYLILDDPYLWIVWIVALYSLEFEEPWYKKRKK
jgi:hypothetical protein